MASTTSSIVRLSLRHSLASRAAQSWSSLQLFSTQQAVDRSTQNVPAGHHTSDLSSSACHIGLGRRRDLTLRQDIHLHSTTTQHTLAEIFKGQKVMLVGFPGGKVCTEKHLPAYVKKAELLKERGVDKVVCVSVMDASSIPNFPSSNMINYYADSRGHFLRALGLDLAPPDSQEPVKCQRFAAIVEDGVLLNLQVEKGPAEVKVSDVDSMCALWERVFQK